MNNNEITFFAKTNFRNQERVFGIKTDDRRRHMYIIGKTGMGKTNLLENLVVQDIRNGHGVCYIDPHGDTAEKLLKSIPANRINDVIYLNPADQNFPLAFNVMESVDPDYRHLVASGLIGVFKKIWADSWGPRLEYILRNAILALLEYPGSTLLGVTRILVDKKYREKVVEKVTDPVIRQFWVDEFPKWSDKVLQEVVSPIQNKVGQFLSSSLIRNIVGQTQSSFDIRDVMDSRKILILNLSKGRIGEDNSALLGAMMITKIQLAAMGRVDMEEDLRKDFYLYVDEFQNFSTESFANILSEARKYRLNLILANQYVEQIIETVRNAIFGNVGTIIAFRVGAMDAEFLEKEFAPVFMQNDIVNLPKYNIYLKLMIDGIAGDAFSATTLPPVYIEDTIENEQKIIAISRERYATPKEEVEDKISRWAGIMPAAGFQTVNKPSMQQFAAQASPSAAAPSSRPAAAAPSQSQVFQAPANRSATPQFQSQQPAQPAQAQPQMPKFDQAQPQVRKSPAFQSSFNNGVNNQFSVPAQASQFVVQPQFQPQQAPVASPEPQQAPQPQNPIQEQPVIQTAPSDELVSYNEPEAEIQVAPKPLFDAICDMCGEQIQIPFQPDGKRPTFCKDCLKDYQRMVAKEKLNQERKAQRDQQENPQTIQPQQAPGQNPSRSYLQNPRPSRFGQNREQQQRQKPEPRTVRYEAERRVEPKAYAPQDKPMSLSQMQHVAPKKFKVERKRPNVNLDEVRSLINNSKDARE